MKKKTLLMTLLAFLFVGTTAWANADWDQYAPETSIAAGKTYVIRSCSNKDFYLRMNPDGFCNNSKDPKGQTSSDDPKTYQWTLEATEGGYALKNVASGTYVSTSVSGYGPAQSTTPIEFAVTYNSDLSAFTISNSSGYLSFKEAYYINFSETAPTTADASTCWTFHELKESVTYVPTTRASSLVAGRNYMIFNASIINYGGKDISGFATHSYGVNGVKLESAKPSQYSSTSKNCLWQLSDNGDGSYKLISVATGKQVNAEGNEADENVKIVNYENNPKKVYDGVSAWLEDEKTTVVSTGIKANHLLWAIHNEGVTKGWNGNANGFATDGYFEPYAFYEVKSYTTEQFEIEKGVEEAIANTGKVGYPKDSKSLQDALAADHAAADYWTNLENAFTDYKKITDVQLPENGKAYKIKAVYGNGSDYLFRNADGQLQHLETASISDPNSMIFVCRKTDNGFVFANYYGTYLAYTNANKGDMPAAYEAKALWTVQYPGVPTHGTNKDRYQAGDFFGRLELYCANQNQVLLPSKKTGEFHNATNPSRWYGVDVNEHSYTFAFEEVDYPNTPKLNEATIDNDAMTLGTFSAPFPTVIPEGVKAFYVEGVNGTTATLKRIQGEAIPANTGVILTAETGTASAVMVPATTETVATIGDNLLKPTSNADFTPGENVYVLGAKGGVVAFYKGATSYTTLGKNKAYLQLSEGAAPALIMSFGNGEATGIEGVEAAPAAQEGAIFDLSGRRVLNPTKGLYIIGGKKVYIK